ncbi:MAG: hypothetical protein V7727_02170 [Sneathiella sp.]
MTPQELFKELLRLFPSAYDKEEAVAWAEQFQASLKKVDPDRLKNAFEATIASWTYARPPRPGDIWKNVKTTKTGIGDFNKSKGIWPHRKMANDVLRNDFAGSKAVEEGWASGLWQFVANNGFMPTVAETREIKAVDEKIRGWEKAVEAGQHVQIETVEGLKPFPDLAQGALLALCERREKILDRFRNE